MASTDLVGQRIAIYARFSSEGQREASIDDQVRRCSDFAHEHGGVTKDELVFSDRATSGAGIDRPGYERMMRLATSKPRLIDVILVEDLSRLSRAQADLFTIQRLLEFSEVRLIGISDGIDTDAKHSRLTFGLKSLVSAVYLDELRDKTLRGLEGRALAGFATGGVAFGYALRKLATVDGKSIGTTIEINEEQAQVVRRIFGLYLDGRSFAAVARELNEAGVAPPRVHAKGRRVGWKDSTIRAMLHNESYAGKWRYPHRNGGRCPAPIVAFRFGETIRRPSSKRGRTCALSTSQHGWPSRSGSQRCTDSTRAPRTANRRGAQFPIARVATFSVACFAAGSAAAR